MTTAPTSTTTPKRGDRIFFQYGCMAGQDVGTVIGEIPNERWGSQWVVRLSDFTTTQVARIAGIVTDSDGIIEGDTAIGAYLVA